MTRSRIAAPMLSATLMAGAVAGEIRSTPDAQTGMAITIYNENLALVKDRRTVSLPAGGSVLAYRDVSAKLRPETALLRDVGAPDALVVVEQNFDYDLLTPDKLLSKYLGQEIRIARMNPATGEETVEQATVLSTNNGLVVRIGDRIETNPGGRYIFDRVPDNLRDKPTLSIQLAAQGDGERELELSYLTGGLAWKADYVAELGADDDRLDLLGWVTLSNNSGASYRDAALQLVAGDVNQVRPQPSPRDLRRASAMQDMAVAESAMTEESLFEYHLYTLGRPTTIADRQTKQVSLLGAAGIPATKELVLQGSDYYYRAKAGQIGKRMKLGVFLQFRNEEEDGLGLPLPKGVVRVYKRDAAGNAQFIGEDAIDHTPKKDKVRLRLGESFDVTADKVQTGFTINEKVLGRDQYESSFRITLNNAREEPVEVIVREPLPGDWQIVRESAPHRKVSSSTAEWRIEVPAEGSTELTYTARVRF